MRVERRHPLLIAACTSRLRCPCTYTLAPPPYTSHPPLPPTCPTCPQVYSMHPVASKGKRVTVLASLSTAEVIVPDLQAGCPAVVHVIDSVLLPDLAADEEAAAASADASAVGMWSSLLRFWNA